MKVIDERDNAVYENILSLGNEVYSQSADIRKKPDSSWRSVKLSELSDLSVFLQ